MHSIPLPWMFSMLTCDPEESNETKLLCDPEGPNGNGVQGLMYSLLHDHLLLQMLTCSLPPGDRDKGGESEESVNK